MATRHSITITIDGETRTLAEWSRVPGAVHYRTLVWRYKHGQRGRDAVFARPWTTEAPACKTVQPRTLSTDVSKPWLLMPTLGSFRSIPIEALEVARRNA